MRSPQKSNRARGRGSRKGNGGTNINRVYESNGPEGKVRGTPQQIIDKYLTLARDAQTSGDRVNSENFLQHAEHYQRVLAAAMGAQQERRDQQQQGGAEDDEEQAAESRGDGRQQQPREQSGGQRQGDGREDSVSGMQTIDASDGESGPELIVTPEEMGSTRSRKRRNGGAQRKSDDAESTSPAEGTAD